ncbi:MAG TPA: hypothetical protein PKW33_04105 [Anaerolineaceae bacterium]|nr:hypothetical protein [Anaerolineaceae bacterium]HPN50745.1 hypothetical protein [Anaerolineaceae bacterium]
MGNKNWGLINGAWYCRPGLILIALLTVLLAACSGPDLKAPTPVPTVPGEIEVDKVFRVFYDEMGGRAVLGPAISGIFTSGNVSKQFTTNAVMVYNPQAPQTMIFSLAPLGEEFVPVKDAGPFEIDPLFKKVYDKLQGSRFIGAPISGVIPGQADGEYYQFFKGLGMRAKEGSNEVGFLEYGAWFCAKEQETCQYQPSYNISPLKFNEKFPVQARRLGRELTGKPISAYFRLPDGAMVQIYDNVVMMDKSGGDSNDRQMAGLYPFIRQIGIQPDPFEVAMNDPRMTFFPVEGQMGYNIPNVFVEFMAFHGGKEESGNPITGVRRVSEQPEVYRVCFETYCLDYNNGLPEGKKIYPAPLGREFLKMFAPEEIAQRGLAPSEADLYIKVWEEKLLISSTDRPVIHIMVLQKGDQTAIPNIDLVVMLIMPDGQQAFFNPPATNMNGLSRLELDPISGQNGDVIPYWVCLNMSSSSGKPLCAEDALAIWGNP